MARFTFEKRTFSTSPESVIEVFVDAQNIPIYAQPYDGSDLVIDYYTSDEFEYLAKLENGIVSLTCPQVNNGGSVSGVFNMIFSSFGGANWQDTSITIRVPRSFHGMLNLCTSCAKISVHNLELGSRLHAITSNAAIEIRGVLASAFEFTTSNAKVYAENAAAYGVADENGMLTPEECKIATSNGAIDLRSFSTLGALSCKSSNGAIKLRETAIQGALTCVTSNGAINLENVSSQELARIKTSNGGIKFDRLLARDMEIITNNSSIKGSIVGQYTDFAVDSRTSNSKNNLPSSSAATGRRLLVQTSNSSIAVEFVR